LNLGKQPLWLSYARFGGTLEGKIRSAVMGDGSLRPLQLVDADEDARRVDAVAEAMAGVPTLVRAPQRVFAIVAEVARLAVLVERLRERLETELVPPCRSRKCPSCRRLSLAVVATRPHPEFDSEGIEQHDVGCGCGYHASRLYDPRDFLR
jgi:hypothetical protein